MTIFCFQTKLENDTAMMRGKIQSLQSDLDNSEAVQRDFVKLSQSLQVNTICETVAVFTGKYTYVKLSQSLQVNTQVC